MAGPSSSLISATGGLLITNGTFNQTIVHRDPAGYTRDDNTIYVREIGIGFELLAQYASPSAFHDSGHQFDLPKCHPNTRVAVQDQIKNWVISRTLNVEDALEAAPLLMWLYGGAGAGKSAIARSIAEWCEAQGVLLASFFFGRTDQERNSIKRFVATIAYGMARSVPSTRGIIGGVIDTDPHVFASSFERQFSRLVLEPLEQLSQENPDSSRPHLVIVDGLDECVDRAEQKALLRLLSSFSVDIRRLGLRFLIASRPEQTISIMFDSPSLKDISTRIALSDQSDSDDDIRRFLEDKFAEIKSTHPRKGFIPADWPRKSDIDALVRKSSGHFIYASTVIKHVQSERHKPATRLAQVLNINPSKPSSGVRDLPFAELDSLYTHILTLAQVEDSGSTVASQVLALCILITRHLDHWYRGIADSHLAAIAVILKLDPEDVYAILVELSSVVKLDDTWIIILHASAEDFLFDPVRSGKLWVDRVAMLNTIAIHIMENASSRDRFRNSESWRALFEILSVTQVTPPLIQALKKLDLQPVLAEFDGRDKEEDSDRMKSAIPVFFALVMTIRLLTTDTEEGKEIYQMQFKALISWIKRNIMGYLNGSTKLRALITLNFSEFNQMTYHLIHLPFGSAESNFDSRTLKANWIVYSSSDPHLRELGTEVREEWRRLRNLIFDGRTQAAAVLVCAQFLLHHPQMLLVDRLISGMDISTGQSRRLRPWLWRRRTLHRRLSIRSNDVQKSKEKSEAPEQNEEEKGSEYDSDDNSVKDFEVEKTLRLLPELLERANRSSEALPVLRGVLLYGHKSFASFADWPACKAAIKSYLARYTYKPVIHSDPMESGTSPPSATALIPESKVDLTSRLGGYSLPSRIGTTFSITPGPPSFRMSELWKALPNQLKGEDSSTRLFDPD